ncbi:hypothetical protein J3E72DRAFT_273532 [Bipolaris maydis]|nr:hypothetical protein J3E72DRAFT_273532 [Bipolaris maydis]
MVAYALTSLLLGGVFFALAALRCGRLTGYFPRTVKTGVVATCKDASMKKLVSAGWLFSVEHRSTQATAAAEWDYWALFNFNKVEWYALSAGIRDIILLVLIGALSLPIFASEALLERGKSDNSMNHEFVGHDVFSWRSVERNGLYGYRAAVFVVYSSANAASRATPPVVSAPASVSQKQLRVYDTLEDAICGLRYEHRSSSSFLPANSLTALCKTILHQHNRNNKQFTLPELHSAGTVVRVLACGETIACSEYPFLPAFVILDGRVALREHATSLGGGKRMCIRKAVPSAARAIFRRKTTEKDRDNISVIEGSVHGAGPRVIAPLLPFCARVDSETCLILDIDARNTHWAEIIKRWRQIGAINDKNDIHYQGEQKVVDAEWVHEMKEEHIRCTAVGVVVTFAAGDFLIVVVEHAELHGESFFRCMLIGAMEATSGKT